MNIQIIKKWKPVLDNILSPYELENETLEMLAEYLEKKLETSPMTQYSTLGGNGIPLVVPPPPSFSPQQAQVEAFNTIIEFKERLAKDIDIRVNVKNVYYNGTIKRIVYELENGDSVYLDSKPLVMRDPDYIKKSKRLFLSISDPENPQLRKFKIEEIRKNM